MKVEKLKLKLKLKLSYAKFSVSILFFLKLSRKTFGGGGEVGSASHPGKGRVRVMHVNLSQWLWPKNKN